MHDFFSISKNVITFNNTGHYFWLWVLNQEYRNEIFKMPKIFKNNKNMWEFYHLYDTGT